MRAVKTDKAQEDFWDTATPGVGIRLTRGGTQTFIVMTRALERGQWVKRRIKIGRVGEHVLDLAEARRRARDIIAAAGEGRNPSSQLEIPPDVQRVVRSADRFANVRADWRIHDLRRTLVTGMNEELHISPHVVESVVNHVSGAARQGAAGVYNRARHLGERRRTLQRWHGGDNQLREKLGRCSSMTLWRMRRDGKLPRPRKLAKRNVTPEDEVDAAIAALIGL